MTDVQVAHVRVPVEVCVRGNVGVYVGNVKMHREVGVDGDINVERHPPDVDMGREVGVFGCPGDVGVGRGVRGRRRAPAPGGCRCGWAVPAASATCLPQPGSVPSFRQAPAQPPGVVGRALFSWLVLMVPIATPASSCRHSSRPNSAATDPSERRPVPG